MAIISKETWNKFTKEEKEKIYNIYNKNEEFLSHENIHYLSRDACYCEQNLMLDIFGKEILVPKIKTWSDIEEYYPNIDIELDKKIRNVLYGCKDFSNSVLIKCVSAIKISKLIELGYGGMVTEEEKEINESCYYAIYPTCDRKEYQIENSDVTNLVARDFISFHTKQQAQEFMSYSDNVELLNEYFMMKIQYLAN